MQGNLWQYQSHAEPITPPPFDPADGFPYVQTPGPVRPSAIVAATLFVNFLAFTPVDAFHRNSEHPTWDVQEFPPVLAIPFNEGGFSSIVEPIAVPFDPADFPWVQGPEPIRGPPPEPGQFSFTFVDVLHRNSEHPTWDVQDPIAPPVQRAVDEGMSSLQLVDGIHRNSEHPDWDVQEPPPVLPIPFDPGWVAFTDIQEPPVEVIDGFPWVQSSDGPPPEQRAVDEGWFGFTFVDVLHRNSQHPDWDTQEPQAPPIQRAVDEGQSSFVFVDGIHRNSEHPGWDIQEFPPVLPIPFNEGLYHNNIEPIAQPVDPAGGFGWLQSAGPVPVLPVEPGMFGFTYVDVLHRNHHHPQWDVQDYPPVLPVPFDEGAYGNIVEPIAQAIDPAAGYPWIQSADPVPIQPVEPGLYSFTFVDVLHRNSHHPDWDTQEPQAPPVQRAVDEGYYSFVFVDGIHRNSEHPQWDVQEPGPVLPITFNQGFFSFVNPEPPPTEPSDGFPWIQASEPVMLPQRAVDEGYFAFTFVDVIHRTHHHPEWDVQEPQAPPIQRAVDEGMSSLVLVDGIHRNSEHPGWDIQDADPVRPIPFNQGWFDHNLVPIPDADLDPANGYPYIQASEPVRLPDYPVSEGLAALVLVDGIHRNSEYPTWDVQDADPVLPLVFNQGYFAFTDIAEPPVEASDGFPWIQASEPVREPERAVDEGYYAFVFVDVLHRNSHHPQWDVQEPQAPPEQRPVDEGASSLTFVDGIHRNSEHPDWDTQDADPVLPIPFNEGLFTQNIDPIADAFAPASGFPWIQSADPVPEQWPVSVGWYALTFVDELHVNSHHPQWDVQEPQAPPVQRAVDEGDFGLTLVDGLHKNSEHPTWDVQGPEPVLPLTFNQGYFAFTDIAEPPVEVIDGFPWIQSEAFAPGPPRPVDVGEFSLVLVDGLHRNSFHPTWDVQDADPVLPIPFNPGLVAQNIDPIPDAVSYTSFGCTILYTAANWTGGVDFSYEVCMRVTSGPTVYARLWDETDGSAVSSSGISSASGTLVRLRVGPVTLVDGHEYRAQFGVVPGDAGETAVARIIAEPA